MKHVTTGLLITGDAVIKCPRVLSSVRLQLMAGVAKTVVQTLQLVLRSVMMVLKLVQKFVMINTSLE